MNHIIETLERNGLISLDSAESALQRLPLRKLLSLNSELASSIEKEDSLFPVDPVSFPDPFRFLASASVRGEAGCTAVDCRARSLSLLARYSALYCDYVAVPFGLHLDPELGVARAREDFLERLVTLIVLRPVIEAGVVRLFIPSRCSHCMQKLPVGIGISKLARRLATEHFNEFTATYLPWEYGSDVRIDGPIEYVDHGALVRPYDKPPVWLPTRHRSRGAQTDGVRLSAQTLRKSHLVEEIFETIAVDVIHQRLEGINRPLNYLMGRRGEAEFLSRLNLDDEFERRTAALCAHLTHSVPTLMDIPISAALAIRKKDHESFLDYRNTIRSIIAEHLLSGGTVSEKDAQQIYLDVLRPRVDKLRNETQIQRRSVRRSAAISCGVPAALLSIGIVGGLLPPEISALLKISCTLGLVNEGLKALLGAMGKPTSSRDNSLYFLLELEAIAGS